jgi:hypothetical protein
LLIFNPQFRRSAGFLRNRREIDALSRSPSEEVAMKKALGVLATVAVVGATAITAPAPAEARHIGPGLAFGLAAGAVAAGAAASAYPYYYDDYYGPRYYGPGPYAYSGGPYYRHRYYRYHDW